MTKVKELFGIPTTSTETDWKSVVQSQHCPYLDKKCLKNRKSEPEVAIGTCTMMFGRDKRNIMICPHRLLERKQIFTDCLHLLTLHEPGNEFHIIPEVSIAGGHVDYVLASVKDGKVKDFVGIELQTMDTTGTAFPERQRFLESVGVEVDQKDVDSDKPFGMNWKHTAKTILVQLHHKVATFEHLSKHFVLVCQDCLMDYMSTEFSFGHVEQAKLGNAMHFHSYRLDEKENGYRLELAERFSTDADGIAKCLGLQAEQKVELNVIVELLESKISEKTRFTLAQA